MTFAFISLPGPTELIIILAIILIIFGPKKIPDIGKSIGKTIREFRKANDDDSKKEVTEKQDEEK